MKITSTNGMTLFDLLNSHFIMEPYTHCNTCHGKLMPITYEQLPKDAKIHFDEVMKEVPYKNKKNELAYCEKCDAYSILSEYLR